MLENTVYSNLQGQRKLVPKNGRFEKSRVKLQRSLRETESGLRNQEV